MTYLKLDRYENLSGKTSVGTELLLATLVFSLVIVYVFIAPQYKQMKIVKEQIRLNQESIDLKKSALQKTKDYNKKGQELKEKDIEKFKNLLQKKNNFENYLANINKIMNTSGSRVILSDFFIDNARPASFSKKDSISGLQEVKVAFTVKGSFDNFVSFLNSLEKSVPLVEFNSIDIYNITEENKTNFNFEFSNFKRANESNILVKSNIEMLFYYIE